MDRLSKEQRRKNMQAVKSKGSKIETLLAKELWRRGYRYRKNNIKIYGKPDFTFKKYKIAIFVDGEFWHGKDWETIQFNIKSNIEYWHKKIQRNVKRDETVNLKLFEMGWQVIRFWGKEIETDLLTCVRKIEDRINDCKG